MTPIEEAVADAIESVQLFIRYNDWTSDREIGLPLEVCRHEKDGGISVVHRSPMLEDEVSLLLSIVKQERAAAAIAAYTKAVSVGQVERWLVSALVEKEGVIGHRAFVGTGENKEAVLGYALEQFQTDGYRVSSYEIGKCSSFAAPPAPIPAGWEYNIDECPILEHSYALLRSGEVKVVWRKGNGDFDYFRFREIEAWMPLQKPDAPPPEATHEND